jgi:hypothetical protein
MKFIFDKVDLQIPEKEFSVFLKFGEDRFTCKLEFDMKPVLNLYLIFHFTLLIHQSISFWSKQ